MSLRYKIFLFRTYFLNTIEELFKIINIMKKSIFFSVLFLLGSLQAIKAQQAHVATGGDVTGSAGSVSYSYGQIFYTTTSNALGTVEKGVQIPISKLIFTSGNWFPMAPSAGTGANSAFVLDGVYNVTTDVAVKNLEISSGAAVVVPSNTTLSINGDLEMHSMSNAFSSLVVRGNAPVTGTSRYHRYVNALLNRNDLISPPVNGQSWSSFLTNNNNSNANALHTNGLTGSSLLYLFGPFKKEDTDSYITYSNTTDATLLSGVGYRAATNTLAVNGDGETLTFEGSVLSSPVNVSIVNDQTGDFEEWNLVGNPFPAYLDVQAFLNHEVSPGITNLSLLSETIAAIYGYDGDDSDGSLWTITNLISGPPRIAPGQGFFLSSKLAASQLQFTDAMQIEGEADDDFIAGRFSSSNTTGFNLKLQGADQQHSTRIYFNENATLGLDPGYDAAHYGNQAPAFSLYSHLVEGNTGFPMAIQTLNSPELSELSIPLGINASQGNALTISLEDATFSPTVNVFLEDNQNNSFTLLNTTAYVFTPQSNLNGTGRFFLHFQNNVLDTPASILQGLSIYTLRAQQQIVIQGQLSKDTVFKLYDINGRLINHSALNENQQAQYIDTSYLSAGVYVVHVLSAQSQRIQKVILY